MALSIPVWSLIVAQFTADYGLYLMQNTLPSFYRQRLGIDVDQVSSDDPYAWAAINNQHLYSQALSRPFPSS